MPEVVVNIRGLAELNRALAELPRKVAADILKGAVGKASGAIKTAVVEKMISQDLYVTGTLQRSVYVAYVPEGSTATSKKFHVGTRKGRRFAAGARVGKRGGVRKASMDAYYAKWVEVGHYARRSKGAGKFSYVWKGHRRDKGQKQAQMNAARAAGDTVTWIPGVPFFRPAWDQHKRRAVDVMGEYIRGKLPAAVAAVRSRA